MNSAITWLRGRKTYIIAAAMVILGILQGLAIFALPEWAWAVIAGVGLTTLRAGVTGIAKSLKAILAQAPPMER